MREISRTLLRPTARRDNGGPLGRHGSLPAGEAGAFGRRLGVTLGRPGGAASRRAKRKWSIFGDFGDFWGILDFRAPPIAAGRADSLLCDASPDGQRVFGGPKRALQRGSYSGIRGATNRARAAFLGHRTTAIAKSDVFSRAKK